MKLVAFDVETSGEDPDFALQPWRSTTANLLRTGRKQAWLTSYAVAGATSVSGSLFPDREELRTLLVRCAELDAYIVGWNTAFDVAWLLALGLRDEVYACKWLDAMLLYRHLTIQPKFIKGLTYGLKAAVKSHWPDEAGYEEDVDFLATDAASLNKLLSYNQADADKTRRLALLFWQQMPDDMRRAALIEARSIPLVAETYINGIVADGEAAEALRGKLEDTINLSFTKLKLGDPGDISREVLASPKQLAEVLYQKWKLRVPKYTIKGAQSTDRETLTALAQDDERAALINEYREAKNNQTKFCQATLDALEYNGDGVVRPQARIFSTYTGRMSYSSQQKSLANHYLQTGIALHQWKRDKHFRRIIKPPEGYTLLEFDFAGQEYKWMAVLSDDQTMLKLCQPGEDPHSFMGSKVKPTYGYRELQKLAATDDVAKQIRYLGKVANLSLQYRTSAPKLRIVAATSYGVFLEPIEARAIHGTYLMTYPDVPKYWKRQINDAKDDGYVVTQAGRRIQLGKLPEWDMSNSWAYESTAINGPIQGTGADQKYLALAVLRDYLPSVDGRFYFELHDGMFVVVPDEKAEKAAHEIKHLLSNLNYKKAWGKTFPILFPVDAKMGKTWGDLTEVN